MKKNIVILSQIGGNDTPFCSYVYNHAKALVNQGNKVTAIIITNYFPLIKKKQKRKNTVIDGIKIIYCNSIGFSNILYNSKLNLNGLIYYLIAKKQIKQILKNEKIDLLDAHYFKREGYAAALLKKKFNIKTYVTLHGTSFNRNLESKNGIKQIKFVGNIIDKYICVSEKIYKQLDQLDIQNKNVIYNGIVPFKISRNNDNHNICTLGSLVKLKNIDYIIKEFKLISNIYDDAKLIIIGDGYLKNELVNLVKKLKISDKVIFKGNISNQEVFKIFSMCNIFALISKPEGFGIAYCEAMYSGCITIGTKGEGIDGYIKDGVNGFLINPSPNELYKKIQYIFNNKCYNIREEAIKIAKSTTWDNNAKKYME